MNPQGYLNRIYVAKGGDIKTRIIYEYHDAIVSGHPSVSRTIASVLSKFYFPDVKPFVQNYLDNCIICKIAKMIQHKKAAADPLPVPPHPFHTSCGMDFITEFPNCSGFDTILVIIDHLTRLGQFIPCKSTITAKETAELFLKEIVCLHGVPGIIVSNRDPHLLVLGHTLESTRYQIEYVYCQTATDRWII